MFQEYNGRHPGLDGANGDFAGGDYYGIHANNGFDQLAIGYAGAESWKMDSSGRVVNVSQPSFAVTWK